MSKIRVFNSAEDFRKSLESNLLAKSREIHQDLERIRRKVAFERLCARLFADRECSWLLKGGYALELRFETARATRDVDLMISDFSGFADDPDYMAKLQGVLREAASNNLEDYFEFRIEEAKRSLEGPRYGGGRYPVESLINGRRFVRFNLDIGLGDVTSEPTEIFQAKGWLADYGFPPVIYRLANVEQQFAEKLHAYTALSSGINTRVKDLVDMILLIRYSRLEAENLRKVIPQVFQRRKAHSLPNALPNPPSHWRERFKLLAKECGINLSCDQAFTELACYLEHLKIL